MCDAYDYAQAIGDRLRRYRQSQDLTQQELAGDAFSKSYISQLENGAVVPSLRALTILSSRLGVPVASLLYGPTAASLLLKGAHARFYLGDVGGAEILLKRLPSDPRTLSPRERREAILLKIRLSAVRERWERVHTFCLELEESLAPVSHHSEPDIAVPHNYWWGKAWLLRGNRHQAVRRWTAGLDALPAEAVPSYEGLKLLFDLAELYRQLGDPDDATVLTTRIRAILAQLTSVEDLCRWTLARRLERDVHAALHSDGDRLIAPDALSAMAHAESWAQAACTLRLVDELKKRSKPSSKGREPAL